MFATKNKLLELPSVLCEYSHLSKAFGSQVVINFLKKVLSSLIAIKALVQEKINIIVYVSLQCYFHFDALNPFVKLNKLGYMVLCFCRYFKNTK